MNAPARALTFAVALAATACFGSETRGPVCVDGFTAGQRLAVRLGPVFDVKGDYYWDASQGFALGLTTRSCAGSDGWATETVVTFELTEPGFAGTDACAPWSAHVQPEPVSSSPELDSNYVPSIVKQSIAASYAGGTLAGQKVFAARGLSTPSEDFRGALTPRLPPPLVVSRYLIPDAAPNAQCFDAWLASWEGTPP